MRQLILKNSLSLGDIVVLTGAVRDLHRCYPGQFLTDVRTSCGELWLSNPHLTPLDENSAGVESLYCEYPLINWSNQVPCHMLYGFTDYLNLKLGLEIKPTEFKGDIHLTPTERASRPALQDLFGVDAPYWLVASGGKHDVTVKWWDADRYQAVVDHFRGRIQFVQVGAAGDFHPKLRGAIDLRGRTSVRDLVRLTYHAHGVLCGVTGLMHLAAAVETREGRGRLRPCVVVAGGREPAHWEAYPGHQFIHTIGALPCCAGGGCWKNRTVPLGDGDERDAPGNLCSNLHGHLPRCMDLISVEDVVRRMELCFEGGVVPRLTRSQARAAARAVAATGNNPYDALPLRPEQVRPRLEWVLRHVPAAPRAGRRRGVVVCAGGPTMLTNAWVGLRLMRHLGCQLPMQVWHLGPAEMDPEMRRLLAALDVECVDALKTTRHRPVRPPRGRELKLFALRHCPFREVLLLDASLFPERDPTRLFDTEPFVRTGAVFWPGSDDRRPSEKAFRGCGLEPDAGAPFEAAAVLVDRVRHWRALTLAGWMTDQADYFHPQTAAEHGVFQLAWRKASAAFAMPERRSADGARLFDFAGNGVFRQRRGHKLNYYFDPPPCRSFPHERLCRAWLEELRRTWRAPAAQGTAPAEGETTPGRLAPGIESESPDRAGAGPESAPVKAPAVAAPERGMIAPDTLTLVTLYDDAMAAVGRLTSGVLREYASRHGYGLRVHERTFDSSRHPSWSKIPAVREVLASAPGGWVMWIDADAVVVNHRVRAETLVPRGFDVVFASDRNGLNAGIFFIRSCDWSLRLLDTVYFLGEVKRGPGKPAVLWEQTTFGHLLEHFDGFADHAVLLPQNRMNSSLDTFTAGDFIVHLGAMSQGERLRHLRHLGKWMIR